ncbi:hypothetical protein [Flavobacterium sp. CLA17]|uniref:hypothetical protein n=1 Tax=Flavobacterium sp. CLA17 TaxID=2724135 RepID=UPI001968A243|nr:hypothetical protein [Flavobacterium sp. CLA17]QSB29259.1 hypothetical protein HAV12_011140 [Flavobacterium sp. CLA17]
MVNEFSPVDTQPGIVVDNTRVDGIEGLKVGATGVEPTIFSTKVVGMPEAVGDMPLSHGFARPKLHLIVHGDPVNETAVLNVTELPSAE